MTIYTTMHMCVYLCDFKCRYNNVENKSWVDTSPNGYLPMLPFHSIFQLYLCVHLYVVAYTCWNQRTNLDIISQELFIYPGGFLVLFWDRASHWTESTQRVSKGSCQWAPGSCLSLTPQCYDYKHTPSCLAFYVAAGHCTVNTLPTELCPLLLVFLKQDFM